VDKGCRQPGQRVQKIMLGVHRDFVGLDGGAVCADGDLAFGPQLVANPAEPDQPHAQNAPASPP